MSRIAGVAQPGLSFAAVIFFFFFVKLRLGRVVQPLRIHALSPANLRGYALMEGAQQSAGSLALNLKKLAQIRVATRVGCPF